MREGVGLWVGTGGWVGEWRVVRVWPDPKVRACFFSCLFRAHHGPWPHRQHRAHTSADFRRFPPPHDMRTCFMAMGPA